MLASVVHVKKMALCTHKSSVHFDKTALVWVHIHLPLQCSHTLLINAQPINASPSSLLLH
jgi:hypothetical protein